MKYIVLIFILSLLIEQQLAQKEVIKINDFDENVAQKIFEEKKQAMVMFTDSKEPNTKLNEFTQAVQEMKLPFVFCKATIHKGIGEKLGNLIGVTDSMLPTVRRQFIKILQIYIIQINGNDIKKFRIEKELTVENIKQFENDYSEGKLTPVFKSEEIPLLNDNLVKKIVGKNFKEIVMDQTKDVLVKFHAPWCKDCKSWVPVFNKVAKQLQQNTNIIIAEYDRLLNENAETIDIVELPTILFFPSNKKSEPIPYTSSRTQQNIIEFLQQHTTFEWIEKTEINKDEL